MNLEEFLILIRKHKGAILTIIIVATLTIFAFNQGLGILYKAELLQDPCSLCESFIKPSNFPVNFSALKLS